MAAILFMDVVSSPSSPIDGSHLPPVAHVHLVRASAFRRRVLATDVQQIQYLGLAPSFTLILSVYAACNVSDVVRPSSLAARPMSDAEPVLGYEGSGSRRRLAGDQEYDEESGRAQGRR
jgi:hypothetical protein